mgnify:CR=1 FL=1
MWRKRLRDSWKGFKSYCGIVERGVKRFLCGLVEHEYREHSEHCRLWLVCKRCGEETEGWNWQDRSITPEIRFLRIPGVKPKHMALSKPMVSKMEEVLLNEETVH